jgi:hypothetical protein
MSARQKIIAQMRPDESGAARNKYSHVASKIRMCANYIRVGQIRQEE